MECTVLITKLKTASKGSHGDVYIKVYIPKILSTHVVLSCHILGCGRVQRFSHLSMLSVFTSRNLVVPVWIRLSGLIGNLWVFTSLRYDYELVQQLKTLLNCFRKG